MDVEAGLVISLGLGLGSCKVDPPDVKWGQLSHAYNFKASLLGPILTVLALLCCVGELQGLLSRVLQLVRVRDSYFSYFTL